MKQLLRAATRRWVIRMTVHEEGVGWRPRREDERPENNPAYWASIYSDMGVVIGEAESIRTLAEREYRRTLANREE
jgi:hypothetical protein